MTSLFTIDDSFKTQLYSPQYHNYCRALTLVRSALYNTALEEQLISQFYEDKQILKRLVCFLSDHYPSEIRDASKSVLCDVTYCLTSERVRHWIGIDVIPTLIGLPGTQGIVQNISVFYDIFTETELETQVILPLFKKLDDDTLSSFTVESSVRLLFQFARGRNSDVLFEAILKKIGPLIEKKEQNIVKEIILGLNQTMQQDSKENIKMTTIIESGWVLTLCSFLNSSSHSSLTLDMIDTFIGKNMHTPRPVVRDAIWNALAPSKQGLCKLFSTHTTNQAYSVLSKVIPLHENYVQTLLDSPFLTTMFQDIEEIQDQKLHSVVDVLCHCVMYGTESQVQFLVEQKEALYYLYHLMDSRNTMILLKSLKAVQIIVKKQEYNSHKQMYLIETSLRKKRMCCTEVDLVSSQIKAALLQQ